MLEHVQRLVLTCVLVTACGRTTLPTQMIDDGDELPQGDATPTDSDIFLLGQTSAAANSNLQDGFEGPSGIAVCGGRMFVADNVQARVLVWNSVPPSGRPDLVLGQPDFTTRSANYNNVIDAQGMVGPDGLDCDATHLVVADASNHRVMIWSPLPTTSFQAADVVLGQADFAHSTANHNGVDGTGMNVPAGVALEGTRLYVADSANHRVLVWDSIPTVNGTSADFALGQPNMTSNGANAGSAGVKRQGMANPSAVAATSTVVAVADTSNNRVLVYQARPLDSSLPDHVLGQNNFTSNAAPMTGTPTVQPHGVRVLPDGSIAVGSSGDDHVHIFAQPSTDGPTALHTLGISSAVSTGEPIYNAQTLSRPRYAIVDGADLYVTDYFAHRILRYDANGSLDTPSAIAVTGQPSVASGAKRCPAGGITASRLGLPQDVVYEQGKIIVADFLYHRVLIWNAMPTIAGAPADVVLGQPDATSYNPIADANVGSTFNFPIRSAVIGGNLYVVDREHQRVVVYDGVPARSGATAAYALGQPDLDAHASQTPVTGITWLQPTCVSSDGTRLLVCDSGHNRVLLWNAIPTDPSTPPNVVLGQPDKSGVASNFGGVNASGMWIPRDAQFIGPGIAVADANNHRVLIWNTIPTLDGTPADVVLGQPDMTTGSLRPADNGSLRGVPVVRFDGSHLYAGTNNRILVWTGIPTANGAAASFVLGQSSPTTDLANPGGISANTFNAAFGIAFGGGRMFVSDTENNRVLSRPVPQ
jgi:hypothetical protein